MDVRKNMCYMSVIIMIVLLFKLTLNSLKADDKLASKLTNSPIRQMLIKFKRQEGQISILKEQLNQVITNQEKLRESFKQYRRRMFKSKSQFEAPPRELNITKDLESNSRPLRNITNKSQLIPSKFINENLS